MNATVGELEAAVSECELVEKFCVAAVIAGLLIEVVAAMLHMPSNSFKGMFCTIEADELVGLGVIGEAVIGNIGKRCQSELQRRSGDRLTEALANADAAHAWADAANTRAEQARLELQKFRAPRGPKFMAAFNPASDMLGRFAKTQFDTAYGYPNQEQAVLVGLIQLCLMEAGWSHLPWAGGTTLIAKPDDDRAPFRVANVRDVVLIASTLELLMAADALLLVLASAGIVASIKNSGGPGNLNTNTMHILVGEKS